MAEHVARHPEDVGRTVEDFNWAVNVIVRPVRLGSGMSIMKLAANRPAITREANAIYATAT